ncbi:Sterol 3-beta-glucosyltransferase [Entomortierella beljakovae]|nr:Sterol 3-beta-glucosyltransferase [Entomortierella beljakovae]
MANPDKRMNPTSGSALLSAITSGFRSSGMRDDVGNDNSEVDELHNAGEDDEEDDDEEEEDDDEEEEDDDNGDEFEYGHDLGEINARLKEQFGYPQDEKILGDVLSAEPSPDNTEEFYIFTKSRKYKFKTDSEIQCKDWVKAIQKSIIHAKIDKDNVQLSLPFARIKSIELNSGSAAKTIRIVIDNSEGSVNELFFAYFNDMTKALNDLKSQMEKFQAGGSTDASDVIISNHGLFNEPSGEFDDGQYPLSSSLSSREHSRSINISRLNPFKLIHPSRASSMRTEESSSPRISSEKVRENGIDNSQVGRRELASEDSSSKFSISRAATRIAGKAIDLTTLSSSDHDVTEQHQELFRKEFSLPKGELLTEYLSGFLLKVIAISGRIYLSNNYICFRGSLTSGTKAIIPFGDIINVEKKNGSKFYFHGVTLTTKDGEDITFEFSSKGSRDRVYGVLAERTTTTAQDGHKVQYAQEISVSPSEERDDPMEPSMNSEKLQSQTVESTTSKYCKIELKPQKSLHITCLTIGSRGDVQPYIAFCKRLIADGHRCRIATHAEYKDWVEGHGIEFGVVGGDPSELIELCVDNGMFTPSFIKEVRRKFRGWLDNLLLTAWEACQNTDLLIESPSAMAGIHIAESLEIPYYRAFPFPWTRTRAFPHPFAVPEINLGRGYNYMTFAMIEQVFWKGVSGQINKWRRNTLGIASTSMEKMDQQQVPVLYSWSPSVVPAPIDWHSWIHVTGYWFLDNADLDWTPPEGLEDFLNADPNNKPVYIGFGSMVVPDPDGMTKIVVDAVINAGARAIVSKGWSENKKVDGNPQKDGLVTIVQNKGEPNEKVYKNSIYMLKSAPHDWLFPRLAGAVHHGGAGTTAASLRAGIPTVIKPYFGDQNFWAHEIEDAGVGVWCHDLTVKKLSAALRTIRTDEKIMKKAKTMGERIRSEDGVGTAIQALYHDLTIAKENSLRHKKENILYRKSHPKAAAKRNAVVGMSATSKDSGDNQQDGTDESEADESDEESFGGVTESLAAGIETMNLQGRHGDFEDDLADTKNGIERADSNASSKSIYSNSAKEEEKAKELPPLKKKRKSVVLSTFGSISSKIKGVTTGVTSHFRSNEASNTVICESEPAVSSISHR